MELPDPPAPWALKSLIEIDIGSWCCQFWEPEGYVYGYGSTARYAVLDAIARIERGETFDRLSGFVTGSGVDLVKALGIVKQPTQVRRL